jgi:chromosome segregation ATPase
MYTILLRILSRNFLLHKIIRTLIQHVEDKEGSNGPSVTMSIHLLEQIRYQREKLESSLCHNDFMRHQLEGLMSSLSSQGGDNMVSLWQKMKETAEQLDEARHENQELETRLQGMEVQFKESREKARLANDVTEKLQVGWHGFNRFLNIICHIGSQEYDSMGGCGP